MLLRLPSWLSALGRFFERLVAPAAIETASAPDRDDIPVAEDVLVMHKFVFDVGRPVDPLDGAQRLLSSDIGTVAIHAPTGAVFNASRLADLKRLTALAQRMSDTAAELQERKSLRGLIWYLVRRPRLFYQVIREWRRKEREAPADETVLDDDDTEADFSIEDVDGLVLEQSLLLAVQHDVDGKVLRPQYLQSDPWIRIELQPCFLTRADGEEHAVDVVLVLHRTGTGVLTFCVAHDGPLTPTRSRCGRSPSSLCSLKRRWPPR